MSEWVGSKFGSAPSTGHDEGFLHAQGRLDLVDVEREVLDVREHGERLRVDDPLELRDLQDRGDLLGGRPRVVRVDVLEAFLDLLRELLAEDDGVAQENAFLGCGEDFRVALEALEREREARRILLRNPLTKTIIWEGTM